jgi:hypothetical protein
MQKTSPQMNYALPKTLIRPSNGTYLRMTLEMSKPK